MVAAEAQRPPHTAPAALPPPSCTTTVFRAASAVLLTAATGSGRPQTACEAAAGTPALSPPLPLAIGGDSGAAE